MVIAIRYKLYTGHPYFVHKLMKTHNSIFNKYAKKLNFISKEVLILRCFLPTWIWWNYAIKYSTKSLEYRDYSISKYFTFIFAKNYRHLHEKVLSFHPISFVQSFEIANNTCKIIIHVCPSIFMIYLSLRWETKIGEVNKNLTSIWRAIRTAKMNNEVIRGVSWL